MRALHKALTLDKCIYMVESYELLLSKAEVIDREIRSLYAIKIHEDLIWFLSIIQRELTPPSIISYPQIIDSDIYSREFLVTSILLTNVCVLLNNPSLTYDKKGWLSMLYMFQCDLISKNIPTTYCSPNQLFLFCLCSSTVLYL